MLLTSRQGAWKGSQASALPGLEERWGMRSRRRVGWRIELGHAQWGLGAGAARGGSGRRAGTCAVRGGRGGSAVVGWGRRRAGACAVGAQMAGTAQCGGQGARIRSQKTRDAFANREMLGGH